MGGGTPHCRNTSKILSKVVERGKINTTNTQIHDRALSFLDTATPIKGGEVKLVALFQAQWDRYDQRNVLFL